MRWLTEHHRDDRGVVTLLAVGLITAFLLASAAAIDVSRFSQENSSAQHSADATALAVATDCVLSSAHVPQPAASYDMYRKTPEQVISASTPINASSCSTGKVTITVDKNVNVGLLLNRDARTAHKTAEVQWGTIGTAKVLPITIADCEFAKQPLDDPGLITIYLPDPTRQSGCSSLPGGFGGLESEDDCSVTISAGGTVDGQPGGGDLHKQISCITPLPQEVLIPVYDATACGQTCGNGQGPYPVIGFAMFRITGYSFNGSYYGGDLDKKCPNDKDLGSYCIRGDFIRFVTSQGTPGPSTDFGTQQVFLSK
jgi:Flp pilus assembly protein TadG